MFNANNLISSIKTHPNYNDEDPDGWLRLLTPIEPKNKPIEYKLGMKVYHKKVYDGREELEIVGIRENELELRGDYSGMGNIIQNSWLPIDGVLLEKQK